QSCRTATWSGHDAWPSRGQSRRATHQGALRRLETGDGSPPALATGLSDNSWTRSAGLTFSWRLTPRDHQARGLGRFFGGCQEWRDQVDRHREQGGRVILSCDFGEGLEVAQLQSDRVLLDNQRGVGQPLRRLKFPLSVDHLGPAFAFSLRLSGNRPL